jgi:hypothetical protein
MADDRLRELERLLELAPSEELEAEYQASLVRAGRLDDALARRVASLSCARAWPDLPADPRGSRVRRCETCEGDVQWAEDAAEAQRYAAAGLCVGGTREVAREVARVGLERLRAGQPAAGRPKCFVLGLAPEPRLSPLPYCRCVNDEEVPPRFHSKLQDTSAAGWHKLLGLIEEAARDGREEFSPRNDLSPEEWEQIVTLPSSIQTLTSVRKLVFYGSYLVRIPPEIGAMTSLEEFIPYTSYRLHWFPYEITRCPKLIESCVSTRTLYGNFKYHPPFPDLTRARGPSSGTCSVCERPCSTSIQAWISLSVATDVLPLLVNACSQDCLDALPPAAEGYAPGPHQGGTPEGQPQRESSPYGRG